MLLERLVLNSYLLLKYIVVKGNLPMVRGSGEIFLMHSFPEWG